MINHRMNTSAISYKRLGAKDFMDLSQLDSDPIFEAIFQIRFESKQDAAASILAGMMYSHVHDTYPKSENLTFPPLPKEVLDNDPRFRYTPEIRYLGDDKILSFGRRMMNVISLSPYCKWSNFKPLILDALGHLQDSGLVHKLERVSFKYSNIIEAGDSAEEQFNLLNCNLTLGGHDLTECPTQIRTEFNVGKYVNIVQVSPFTKLENPISGNEVEGLLLDIDTILNIDDEFWKNKEAIIEEFHKTEKDIFKSILKESTLERYV